MHVQADAEVALSGARLVIKHLVALASSHMEKAASVLSMLRECCDNGGPNVAVLTILVEEKGIELMLVATSDGTDRAKEYAADLMILATRYAAGCTMLVKAGSIELVIELVMLASTGTKKLREKAAFVLTSMTSGQNHEHAKAIKAIKTAVLSACSVVLDQIDAMAVQEMKWWLGWLDEDGSGGKAELAERLRSRCAKEKKKQTATTMTKGVPSAGVSSSSGTKHSFDEPIAPTPAKKPKAQATHVSTVCVLLLYVCMHLCMHS